MTENNRYLQLRISSEMHKEIESAAQKFGITSAQIIRSALFFGLPVFDSMMELQTKTANKIIELLRKDSRSSRQLHDGEKRGDSDKKIVRDDMIPHYDDKM
jgi:antitoxin component of RelBE/YafQ-DinJ toxin-antitoxin module